MKVAVFLFTHFDCEAVGSFVFSKPDIRWIENIETLFSIEVFSYSMPTVSIL